MTDQGDGLNIPIRMGMDQAALQKSQAGLERLEQGFLDLKKVIEASGQSADKTTQALSDAFQSSRASVADYARGLDQVRQKLGDLSAESGKAGKGFSIEGLRRTGGALSQLGLGDLGGLVSRAGDLGQIVKEGTALLNALGPLAPILAGVTGAALGLQAGMKILDAELIHSKESAAQAVAGLEAYYQALDQGTSQSIKKQIDELTKLYNQKANELNQLSSAMSSNLQMTGNVIHDVAVIVGNARGDFSQFTDKAKALKAETDELRGKIEGLTRALQDDKVAANDRAEALRAQQNETMRQLDLSVQAQRQELANSKLSSEQMAARVKDLKDEQAIIQSQLQVLQPLIASNEEAKKKYEGLQSQMVLVVTEIDSLTKKLIPAKAGLEQFQQGLDKLKGLGELIVKGVQNAAEYARKAVEERDQRVIEVQQKYESDVKAAETRGLEERAAIQKRYNDRLVELARQAADDAASALQRLRQQQTDLRLAMERDEAKADRAAADRRIEISIQAARADEKAAQDHFQRMAEIRRSAEDREFDLILNRDFLGLFQSRRQTSRDLERETEQYNQQRQQRLQAYEQQNQDEARQRDIQRRERLIAYQQQLADARLAYQRDIEEQQRRQAQALRLARQERSSSLAELSQKLNDEARLRSQAYQADLRLASLYGQAFVKAHDNINAAILQRANQMLARLGAGGALVSTTNASSTHMVNNFNISGSSTPQNVANVVLNVLRQVFK